MALPGKLNLVTYQGDTFEREFQIEELIDGVPTPVDFTNHNIIGQIRTHSASPIISAMFDIEWVNRSEGEFLITLNSHQTSRLAKTCVYDIQTSDEFGNIRTWVYGNFRTLRQVSRG